ncbi:MAG: CmcI family methyltransferase [Bacteroidota bacterium]
MLGKIIKKITAPAYTRPMDAGRFEVNNWDLSSFILKKLIPVVGHHPFPLNELALMTAAVAWTRPTHIFEWGTHIGKSARIFYETGRFLKIDAEVHSIDLPDDIDHVEHPHGTRGKLVKGKKNVFLHQGDGVDTALRLYQQRGKNSKPLFYLDGDHSYETVSRELQAILVTVPDPKIILHDTFYQTGEPRYNIGPYQAIEDTLAKFPHLSFNRIDTNTGLPGMTFLYPAK